MSAGNWLGYAALVAGSAALALTFTPVARSLAHRVGALDEPGGYKLQRMPVPYLGGIAIVGAFAVIVIAAVLVLPDVPVSEPVIIVGIALGLALVGLVDDLRGLTPWTRFAFQTAAAFGVLAAGIRVELAGVPALDIALTVVWIVGVTNAFNLLDNMDGLSAGVTAICSGFFFLIAGLNGQFLVASLSAALTGAALGFLWHNKPPATIYMGDAGSLFFGFLLAVLGIKLRFDGPTEVTFFVPILVVGTAVFDTALVFVTRLRSGRSPFVGGRDHVSHRLVALGMSVPTTIRWIYAVTAGLGWMALVMSRIDRTSGFMLMAFLIAVAAVAGVLLGRVSTDFDSAQETVL